MTSVFARSYSQLSLHPSSHLCCLHHYRMYCNCTGPGFALHSDIVMPYIVNYGSKEQIKHFIPKMTAGKCIAAIAMTEPGAGRSGLNHRCNIKKSAHIMSGSFSDSAPLFFSSDLQGVRTYAKKDGSDWILNGNKVLSQDFKSIHSITFKVQYRYYSI